MKSISIFSYSTFGWRGGERDKSNIFTLTGGRFERARLSPSSYWSSPNTPKPNNFSPFLSEVHVTPFAAVPSLYQSLVVNVCKMFNLGSFSDKSVLSAAIKFAVKIYSLSQN